MEDCISLKQIIDQNGFYVGTVRGTSMTPMLEQKLDVVVIFKKQERLKRLDVVLFIRNGKYLLHRVIKVKKWGYITRGDNCLFSEKVLEKNAIGVLTEYQKGDKTVKTSDKEQVLYANKILKDTKKKTIKFILRHPIKYFILFIRNFKGNCNSKNRD